MDVGRLRDNPQGQGPAEECTGRHFWAGVCVVGGEDEVVRSAFAGLQTVQTAAGDGIVLCVMVWAECHVQTDIQRCLAKVCTEIVFGSATSGIATQRLATKD